MRRARHWLASIRGPQTRPVDETDEVATRDDGRPHGSVGRLLAAGRRLGSSIDPEEILAILIDEATSLTDSEGAAVVDVGSGAALDRATVAVPLARPGGRPATVVVWRAADRPYDAVTFNLLEQLVPLAGAALIAAERAHTLQEVPAPDMDLLTTLGNRRRLTRDLLSALAGSTAGDSGEDRTVGFVMVDIDHFTQYNDDNGLDAGDDALRLVASLLRGNVRDEDVVYRSGGEEFCVLLPNATQTEARAIAERLRRSIEECPFVGAETQPGGRLTISVAMTMASKADSDSGLDSMAVTGRAELAMNDAKRAGRNRVVESR